MWWRRASEICVWISDYEGARTHEFRFKQFGDRVGAKLAELIRRGLALPRGQYDELLVELAELRATFEKDFAGTGVLTAAAPGHAPLGLGSTGDPVMNRAWTALGVPAITVRRPKSLDHDGLPLGLQIAAARGDDGTALAAACAWEEVFRDQD